VGFVARVVSESEAGVNENTAKTTGDILRAAAARVRRGWCQGQLDDGKGNVCAVGAIMYSHSEPDILPLRDVVVRALALPVPPLIGSEVEPDCPIPIWNDAPGQTAANVAAGLEYAALVWEQEQASAVQQPQTSAIGD
jgi:hypothetical protein